jgi:hypothetical protein
MNTNKIGVYNLNNPFTQNVRHEEQLKAYRDNIRERTMELLSNYSQRIKEETCKLVLAKIEPILIKNSDGLSELKIQTERTCERMKKELVDHTDYPLDYLNQKFTNINENYREIKHTIKVNSNFFPLSQQNEENSSSNLLPVKDSVNRIAQNILSDFEHTLHGVEENSKIYSNLLNQTNQTTKLMELKIFLSEKIKKIYDTFNVMNSIPSEEVVLLEKLKITLEKVEVLMSLHRGQDNIIESCSGDCVYVNSNKIGTYTNNNYFSSLKNSKFSSNFKFDIQSIPSFYSGLKNTKLN